MIKNGSLIFSDIDSPGFRRAPGPCLLASTISTKSGDDLPDPEKADFLAPIRHPKHPSPSQGHATKFLCEQRAGCVVSHHPIPNGKHQLLLHARFLTIK